MSSSDACVRSAAPCIGADTDQVLRDVCGLTADEIERLRAAGALA
jgi:crotonobetainyl-CoA:carnitine CoA-transferase CaiB-like acyl-CoA transferase